MTEQMEGQMSLFDQDMPFTKTSPEPSAPTKEKTSEPCLKKQPKLQTKMPMFLDLRAENGVRAGAYWETDGVSLGEYMTPNIGEFHSGENAYVYSLTLAGTQQERYCLNCSEKPLTEIPSKLSWILEKNPDPKYNLSQKACLGILRRAENRGKTLPPMLESALRRQAGVSMDGMFSQSISSQKTESQNPCMPESVEGVAENPMLCSQEQLVSKKEQENQGGGKGILIQNEHVGALSTLNNQSVCCLNDQGGSVMGVSEDVTGALRAQEHGHQPVVFEPGAASRVGGHVYDDDVAGTVRANAGDNQQAVVYGISAYDSNAMKSANPNSGIYKAETSRTLDLNGGSPACNQGGMAVVCVDQGAGKSQCGVSEDLAPTLATTHGGEPVILENHPNDSRVKVSEDGMVQTLSSRMGTGGGNVPMVMEGINGEISGTLDASYYKGCGERQGVEREVVCVGNGQLAQAKISDKVGTLNCMHDQQAVITYNSSVGALCTDDYKGPNRQYVEQDKLQIDGSVVRRLTPMECERLQGFPDGWTDIGDWVDSRGKTHKGDADSPRYKALGNSIALPFWQWMARRMVSNLGQHPTMASLFDGISGFCLVFARAGARPVFSSEIEEFPIAVAKKHFGDDDLGLEGDYERYL